MTARRRFRPRPAQKTTARGRRGSRHAAGGYKKAVKPVTPKAAKGAK